MQETITRRSLLASVLSTLGISQLPPLPAKPPMDWSAFYDEDYTVVTPCTLETLANFEWIRDRQRVHCLFTSSYGRKVGYTVDTWIVLHKRLLSLMMSALDRWTFDLAIKVFEKKTGAVRKGVWSGPDITELESVARS